MNLFYDTKSTMKFSEIYEVWVNQPVNSKKSITILIKDYEAESKQEVDFNLFDKEKDGLYKEDRVSHIVDGIQKLVDIFRTIPKKEMSEFNMFFFERVNMKYNSVGIHEIYAIIITYQLLDVADAIEIKNCLLNTWEHVNGGVNRNMLDDFQEYIIKQQMIIIKKMNGRIDRYEEKIIELIERIESQQIEINNLVKENKLKL